MKWTSMTTQYIELSERKLAVVGLGYVGLPLAVEFGKIRPVMGFDIHKQRIDELKQGQDITRELSAEELGQSKFLYLTSDLADIASCDTFIITVPTPIDMYKQPDFGLLVRASEMVAPFLKPQSIVIYESTVYPGAIEEIAMPALEKGSHLQYNQDFFIGYSPERINPGDKVHTLTTLKKINTWCSIEHLQVSIKTMYWIEIIISNGY